MGEFFKGWRRKAGLVTLAMACALTTAWMRSLAVCDQIFIPQGYLTSFNGRLYLSKLSHRGSHDRPVELFVWDSVDAMQLNGFAPFGTWFPYWSFVLPLTLLSVWLILGKTRKRPG